MLAKLLVTVVFLLGASTLMVLGIAIGVAGGLLSSIVLLGSSLLVCAGIVDLWVDIGLGVNFDV